MKQLLDIAVVIPYVAHANILRRTFEHLLHQTIQPSEVLLVDDGSREDPTDVLREFEQRLPIQSVRFAMNRGAPAARNEGARRTTSPLLLFLDADVELVPHALETFRQTLCDHPEMDFAYSNFYWGFKSFHARPFDLNALARRNFIHTSSLLRRSAFPGFDESIKKFQDWDLWLMMSHNGSRGIWIDEFLYRIEPKNGSMSTWLPRAAHSIPWPLFGWMPREIERYRVAERIIREKHHIQL